MANYLAIKSNDINNGPGVRLTFWFAGCTFRCKGCHNEESWDFESGKKITDEVIDFVVEELRNNEIMNLSILGGEPLHPNNVSDCERLVRAVKEHLPEKNIWIWTGFNYESLKDEPEYEYIFNNIDVLVDGRYNEDLKVKGIRFKGSTNQRVIDLKETNATGEVKEYLK